MICTKGNLCPTLVGGGGGGGEGIHPILPTMFLCKPNKVSMQVWPKFTHWFGGSEDADGGPLTISTKNNISVHRLRLEGYQNLGLHCLNRLTTSTFSDNKKIFYPD